MKKLMVFTVISALALAVSAAEAEKPENLLEKPEGNPLENLETEKDSAAKVENTRNAMWPACLAFYNLPDSPDVVGIRFTFPFSTRQESITGIDIGFWGSCQYFEGLMCSIIRNDARERCSGLQVGIYNSVGRGDLIGIQAGLWNEAHELGGVQAGIINVSGYTRGFQVGLINRAESMYGYQLGLINIIRDAEVPFMVGLNIGF